MLSGGFLLKKPTNRPNNTNFTMKPKPTPVEAFYAFLRPALKWPGFLIIEDDFRNGIHCLSLYPHPEDRGRIIGRQGSNIAALNELADAFGENEPDPIRILLPDPQPGEAPVKNLRYHYDGASFTEEALTGIQAILAGAAPKARASFVPRAAGGHTLVVAPAIPERIAMPLDRWLSVLAHTGQTKLMLDAAATV